MGDWLDNLISEEMKNPEFKKAWDKYEPEYKVIQYLLEHDIPFTQEFLDILDELTEKGLTLELVPVNKLQAVKVPEPEAEYA